MEIISEHACSAAVVMDLYGVIGIVLCRPLLEKLWEEANAGRNRSAMRAEQAT